MDAEQDTKRALVESGLPFVGAAPAFTSATASEFGRRGARRSAEVRRERGDFLRSLTGSCPCCGRGSKRKLRRGDLVYLLPRSRELREEIQGGITAEVGSYTTAFPEKWPPTKKEVAVWRNLGCEVRIPPG